MQFQWTQLSQNTKSGSVFTHFNPIALPCLILTIDRGQMTLQLQYSQVWLAQNSTGTKLKMPLI